MLLIASFPSRTTLGHLNIPSGEGISKASSLKHRRMSNGSAYNSPVSKSLNFIIDDFEKDVSIGSSAIKPNVREFPISRTKFVAIGTVSASLYNLMSGSICRRCK